MGLNRIFYVIVFITLLFSISITTYFRNIIWNDELTLWEDVVKKSPEKARGHSDLGLAYYKGQLNDAIKRITILAMPMPVKVGLMRL
ncbi:MAG: hypothetical protein HZB79_07280 [Deltaproteobacteria bacterium]|nr:hypothetical protein [Deltaproteobacteria bacterium]